jgi:hypothetical protein
LRIADCGFPKPVAVEWQRGLVLQGGEDLVAESRHEDALDQVGRKPPAAAVAELDAVVLRLRQLAGAER